MAPSLAARAFREYAEHGVSSTLNDCTNVQHFYRENVYTFSDGSRLCINFATGKFHTE